MNDAPHERESGPDVQDLHRPAFVAMILISVTGGT
jgi:hypothetical protein